MKSIILSYLLLNKPLGYALAFLGMIIGGDEVLFTASFLTRYHFFRLKYIILVVLAGALLGDYIWYKFGTKMSEDSLFGKWISKITSHFDEHLKNNSGRTIFISKFIYGFNHIVLARAGMLGVPVRKVFISNGLATIFWVAIIGSLGYFSSSYLRDFKDILRYTEIALLLGLIGFLILEGVARHFLKKVL